MKIQELRNLIKETDRELLEKAFIETYKQLTKGKKEDADQIIKNIFEGKKENPKSQRPKWRFMVKEYIKELEKISTEDENFSRAVKLLTDIYHLLCEACKYYLFSTDNPFRSVGWEQQELFQKVVKKNFALGYAREKIAAMLLDAASGGLRRESLHICQERVLVAELKVSDVKYMAIEEAQKLIEERKKKLKGLKKYLSKL